MPQLDQMLSPHELQLLQAQAARCREFLDEQEHKMGGPDTFRNRLRTLLFTNNELDAFHREMLDRLQVPIDVRMMTIERCRSVACPESGAGNVCSVCTGCSEAAVSLLPAVEAGLESRSTADPISIKKVQQLQAQPAIRRALAFLSCDSAAASSILPDLSLGTHVCISDVELEMLSSYMAALCTRLMAPKTHLGTVSLRNCGLSSAGMTVILRAMAHSPAPPMSNLVVDLSQNLPGLDFHVDKSVQTALIGKQRRVLLLNSSQVCWEIQEHLLLLQEECARLHIESHPPDPSFDWWNDALPSMESSLSKRGLDESRNSCSFETYMQQEHGMRKIGWPQVHNPADAELEYLRSYVRFKLNPGTPFPQCPEHLERLRNVVLKELVLCTGFPECTFKHVVIEEGCVVITVIVGIVLVGTVNVISACVAAHLRRQSQLQSDAISANFLRDHVDPGTIVDGQITDMQDALRTRGRKRVLCLDGGGIKGICTLKVLETLEEALRIRVHTQEPDLAHLPVHLSDMFDLMVGTSTGGVLSFALRAEMSPTNIEALYRNLGRQVFGQRLPGFRRIVRDLTQRVGVIGGIIAGAVLLVLAGVGIVLFDALSSRWYDEELLVELLQRELPDDEEETRHRVYVTAKDIAHNEKLFIGDGVAFLDRRVLGSPTDPLSGTVSGIAKWEACRATSAAPSYFPPWRGRGMELVDGGVFANNPTLEFLTRIQEHAPADQRTGWERLVIVSVGTGLFREEPNAGSFWWLFLQDLLQGATETEESHKQAEQICRLARHPYHRLNLRFGNRSMTLDAHSTEELDYLANSLRNGAPMHSHVTRRVRAGRPEFERTSHDNINVGAILNDCLTNAP